MYPWDQTRMNNFIQHIWPDQPFKGKSMHFDENNKKILDEAIIRFIVEYQKHLEYIYTIYVQDNLDNKGNINKIRSSAIMERNNAAEQKIELYFFG